MAKRGHSKQEIWIQLTSERLKELRKEAGYSSYETFATENDLDRKQYWRVENGLNITIRTLTKILGIHKKPLSEFFKEVENKKKLFEKSSV